MLKRLDNYKFKKARTGKYRKYVSDFLESGELQMYWQCNDKTEARAAAAGFRIELERRKITDVIVRCSEKDFVAGMERE